MSDRRKKLLDHLARIEDSLLVSPDSDSVVAVHASLLAALRLDAEIAGDIPTQHATVMVAEPESE